MAAPDTARPAGNLDMALLRPSGKRTQHPRFGEATKWWPLEIVAEPGRIMPS